MTRPDDIVRTHIGDPLTPVKEGPDVFHAELKENDDNDNTKNKFRRAGRAMARNVEGLETQAKDTAKSISQVAAREPVETVGIPSAQQDPVVMTGQTGAPAQDIVSNSLLMVTFAAEGFARLLKKKRGRQ